MTALESSQWAVFLLTNVIVVPVVVGAAFRMSAAEMSVFMQHMLVVTGLASLVQGFVGHRLPIAEGAAGMWWALFILLATITPATGHALLLRQLELGMLVAGVLIAVIGLMPWVVHIRRMFTPIVTGVYLVLLVAQMSGSFFHSMLGISRTGHLDGRVILVSFVVVLVVLVVSLKAPGVWRSLGPLFGIAAGWAGAALLGVTAGSASTPSHPGSAPEGWFALPQPFVWGTPVWDTGIVITSVLTALILISNVIASLIVGGIALNREITPATYRRGIFGNGIGLILSSLFSVVGVVPLSVSGGFIGTTGIRRRLPFLIGAAVTLVIGLLPPVGRLFAHLPQEVAYASLFVPFSQMMGFGIRDLMGERPTPRNLLVIGLSLMIGIGLMFMPPAAFEGLPAWLRNILANGLLVGLMVCLVLEHLIFRRPRAVQVQGG